MRPPSLRTRFPVLLAGLALGSRVVVAAANEPQHARWAPCTIVFDDQSVQRLYEGLREKQSVCRLDSVRASETRIDVSWEKGEKQLSAVVETAPCSSATDLPWALHVVHTAPIVEHECEAEVAHLRRLL